MRSRTILAFTAIIVLVAICPADADDAYARKLAERRTTYITELYDRFSAMDMDPEDGRRWALNHARLALDREVEEANTFFANTGPIPHDADIFFIRFLRTYLEFKDTPRLSEAARKRLGGLLKGWPENDLSTKAHWPPRHTENHDLMHLTLGLYAMMERGQDVTEQYQAITKFIDHRLERGFVEWNSKCYQYHFSQPLIILADFSPDENVRAHAGQLLNVLLAERALLSVNGYLAGPAFRCRTADAKGDMTTRKVAYLNDARYDGFLPVVWLAFGKGEPYFDFNNARVPGLEPASIHIASGNEPRLKQDEGLFFACSDFEPHPVVRALAEEAGSAKSMVYSGQRFIGWPPDEHWKTQKWMPAALYYYNTPHVSMGSVHSDGCIVQTRYNSVIFGADPSMGLRVEVFLPDVPSHKRRYEARGRVVQHKNWLLGQGTLYEDGGITPTKVGAWDVYTVGQGLCAHYSLPDDYHVLQISDLDTWPDAEAFVAALNVPALEEKRVTGQTVDGDRVAVDVANMAITINGEERVHPPTKLHNSPYMNADYGDGAITITTTAGTVTFNARGVE